MPLILFNNKSGFHRSKKTAFLEKFCNLQSWQQMDFPAVENCTEIVSKRLSWFVLTFVSASLYDMQKKDDECFQWWQGTRCTDSGFLVLLVQAGEKNNQKLSSHELFFFQPYLHCVLWVFLLQYYEKKYGGRSLRKDPFFRSVFNFHVFFFFF